MGAAALLIAAIPATLRAQWPAYHEADVPRLADGKPNLEAPTPRTPDGKPDLSGLWQNIRGGGKAGNVLPDGSIAVDTFRDIGAGIKGGLPFQPWARDLMKARLAENDKDNPDAHCLPMGLTQFHTHPQPRKIIQTPKVTVILYEANGGIRQIFTDGRPLPKNGEVQPWWYGYSVGKWEGDTLVVETTGLRDGGYLDINGSPQTEAATYTERFRRLNYGNLQIDVTIDDPKAYTKPFTVRVEQRIMPDAQLIEFICNENDTSPKHMVGK